MAGASSGWFKSSAGAKRKVFISAATIAARFPYGTVASVKARLRDPLDLASMVDTLGEASPQPKGQALPAQKAGASSIIPQRSKADIAAKKQAMLDSIREDIPYYNLDVTRTPEEIATLAVDTLKRAVANASVAMRITPLLLGKVLKSAFKNQHQTGTSKGTLDPELRARWESGAFGLDQYGPPESFPLYGYMSPPGLDKAIDNASSYGSVKVVFKDAVKDRTTLTAGDSLGGSYLPTPLNDIGLTAIDGRAITMTKFTDAPPAKVADAVGYIEAQIHGGLQPSDIASVQFSPLQPPSKALQKTLTTMGIPWSYFSIG
jgi:hypothetical protein